MNHLLATTAIVLALGLPAGAMAQTEAPAETVPMVGEKTEMSTTTGFLAKRGMTDLLATDLIGHDVYARRTATDMQTPGTMMTGMTAKDLESMDNIGQINDLVLSTDGSVQAVVIGVGGFVGVGEQDVAVTMDQIGFATDTTNPDELYIVVNTTGEMLKTSPAFDRTAAMDEADAASTALRADSSDATSERTRLTAPDMTRDGYSRVAVGDVSLDMLIGKSVYGLNDRDVGTVDDVIMDEKGAVQHVIIDFGGFLGIGATQVALSFDELTILTDEGKTDIRVYVDATKEQVQAMPTYVTTN